MKQDTFAAGSTRDMTALAGKYMTFKLASEEYGVPILTVRELIGLMEITRVPQTPAFVRGVINLRGKVIPVIDLKAKFGMPATVSTDQTVIIVVQLMSESTPVILGVLVDEVLEVLDIASGQIEPPPIFGSSAFETDFILGVGKQDSRVIFLLDIEKVLAASEKAALARVSG